MSRVHMTDAEETYEGQSGPEHPTGRLRRFAHSWGGADRWRRGWLLAVLAVTLALVLLLHAEVPNAIGNLGSLWETFLPWGGLLVPVLLVGALIRRSVLALVALLVPAIAWFNLFGGLLSDRTGGMGDLTVVTHNVGADNPDPAGTARQLAASDADIIALEEVAADRVEVYDKQLEKTHPYHNVQGTVGVWSTHPLKDSEHVDIGMGWKRALRSTVHTPEGEVAVYAAHMPSVRVQFRSGFTAEQRDRSAELLGERIREDPVKDVVLLGDLNGTMNDRALAPITAQMRSTQGASGEGMGFSWPAGFPMARIDQIMVRGLEPESSWTMGGTGSDHLPVAASVNFP